MPYDGPYANLMEKHGFIPANHAAPQFFDVQARRLFDEKGDELPGYKRIVRVDDGTTLHVAGDGYKVVTNEEAFGAFEKALDRAQAEGRLDLTDMQIGTDYAHGGRRTFRQYLLPAHQVEVKPGVLVALRLLMMNSYDGSLKFQGYAGAYDFVCANTTISGKEIAGFKIAHRENKVEIDIAKAIEGLTKAAGDHVEEMRRWKAWPAVPVTDIKAISIFEALPQGTKSLRNALLHNYVKARDEDPVQGGANAWCLFNVLTRWATHSADTDDETGQIRGAMRFDRQARVAKLIEGPEWRELVTA
jgi:hypothetical protein